MGQCSTNIEKLCVNGFCVAYLFSTHFYAIKKLWAKEIKMRHNKLFVRITYTQ